VWVDLASLGTVPAQGTMHLLDVWVARRVRIEGMGGGARVASTRGADSRAPAGPGLETPRHSPRLRRSALRSGGGTEPVVASTRVFRVGVGSGAVEEGPEEHPAPSNPDLSWWIFKLSRPAVLIARRGCGGPPRFSVRSIL